MLLSLLVLADFSFRESLYSTSLRLTQTLQRLPLAHFSRVLSNVVYPIIFVAPLALYLIEGNPRQNLRPLIGCFFLIFLSNTLKLVFVDDRPCFRSVDVPRENCVCDYGKPSGHGLLTTGFLLFMYGGLKERDLLSEASKKCLKFSIVALVVLMGVARVHLGAHTFMQYLIGVFTGQLGFLVVTNYAESLNKHLFYPLFKKSRLKVTDAVSNILFLLVLFNMVFFTLYSVRRNYFEVVDSGFFQFASCRHCLRESTHTFSNKLLLEGLSFNLGFGILLGIYAWPHRFYDFRGIYFDRNRLHVALRVVLLLTIASPYTLVFAFQRAGLGWRICTIVVVSLVAGYFCSNGFLRMSDAVTGGDISEPSVVLKNESLLKVVPFSDGLPFEIGER